MYNVHIRRFNRSMFTGKLSQEAMAEEHAEELEAIERGEIPPEPPVEVIALRKRRFWPYAAVMTVLLVGGLIWFVSFEQTAIPTVPRQLSDTAPEVTVSENVAANLEEVADIFA